MSHDAGANWFGALPADWSAEPMNRWFRERRTTVSDTEFEPLSVTMRGVVKQLDNVAKTDNGSSRKLVRSGDFAINSRSDRRGSSGVSPLDGSVSVITTVLEPLGLEPRFTHYLLRSPKFQEEFYRWGHGIVEDLWTTKWSDMKSIRLPVPPIHVQGALADYLDRVTARIDAFIAKNEDVITSLLLRGRALVERAVTGRAISKSEVIPSGQPWFGDVPLYWRVSRLSRWFTVTLGKMLDESAFAHSGDERLPYVRAANIQPHALDLSSVNQMPFSPRERVKFDLRAGDLLVVEGGSIGVNVHLDEDMPGWGFQKTVNRVRSRGAESTEFVGLQLDLIREAGGLEMMTNLSTIAHFTAEKLERTIVALPSPEEQREIVAYVRRERARIDAAIATAREAIALAKERRAALISAAVTGQLDIPDAA